MKINTNIPALRVLGQMNKTNSKLDKALERLSSGKKINKAADDAAGLAISKKMQVQITGLTVAKRNANDGISLLQTAEGALEEVHSILQRGRELSVQAANGSLDEQDRKAVQEELKTLNQELQRISDSIDYNGMTLLDGSIDIKSYVKGGLDKTVSVISTSDGVSAGKYEFEVVSTATKTNGIGNPENGFISRDMATSSGTFFINGVDVKIVEGDTCDEIFEKVRDAAARTNVNVTCDGANYCAGSRMIFENNEYGDIPIKIEGSDSFLKKLGIASSDINFESTNVYKAEWQIEDTLTPGSLAAPGTSILDNDANIFINGRIVNLKAGDSTKELYNILNDSKIPGTVFTYDNATGKIGIESSKPLIVKPMKNEAGDIAAANLFNSKILDGMDTNVIPSNSKISGCKGRDVETRIVSVDSLATAEIEGFPAGVTTHANGNKLKFTGSNDFEMFVETGNQTGKVELYMLDAGALDLQIGANEGQIMTVRIPNMSIKALELENVNVLTDSAAQKALESYDKAITLVSNIRSKLGAFQNRLEHTTNSLDSSNENLTSSLSQIEDADMAEEMAQYAQLNVLAQAGVSILAQANQRPEAILQLLNK